MILNKFELNEYYKKEILKYGYTENDSIWNILIDIKKKTLYQDIKELIKEKEIELKNLQEKHKNCGVYTKEYKKIQSLKQDIDMIYEKNYNHELVTPIDNALDDLLYCKNTNTENQAYKVALEFLDKLK